MQGQLPTMKEHVHSQVGKSTLYWNYFTGKCCFGLKCCFATGHVHGYNIPNGFVEDAVRSIMPGVAELVCLKRVSRTL